MCNQGSNIDNPEVVELNTNLPEEEMPAGKMGKDAEMPAYNPDSDRSFISDHNDDSSWNEEAPIFVGMTLTADDSDNDDKASESGDKDVYDIDDSNFLT